MVDSEGVRKDLARVCQALFSFDYKKDLFIHIYSKQNFPPLTMIANTIQTGLERNNTWLYRVNQAKDTKNLPITSEIVTLILLLNDDDIDTVEYQFGTTETNNRPGFKILFNFQYTHFQELLMLVIGYFESYLKNMNFNNFKPTIVPEIEAPPEEVIVEPELGEMSCCCCCKYKKG